MSALLKSEQVLHDLYGDTVFRAIEPSAESSTRLCTTMDVVLLRALMIDHGVHLNTRCFKAYFQEDRYDDASDDGRIILLDGDDMNFTMLKLCLKSGFETERLTLSDEYTARSFSLRYFQYNHENQYVPLSIHY